MGHVPDLLLGLVGRTNANTRIVADAGANVQ
jgi:hypothetical protein